jgi:signal transduction histidine kinase
MLKPCQPERTIVKGLSTLPRRVSTARAMTLLWTAFALAYFVFFYVFQDAKEIAEASLTGYLEVVLLGVPIVVLLAGRMWLSESEVDRDLRPRILGSTIGMAFFFVLAMYLALFVIETRFDPGERWLILLMSAGFGASSGAVLGIFDIRSKQRMRERNASRRIARRKERERSQLEYLNHYLRHEVLNEAQKINGFATVLAEQDGVRPQDTEYLDTIRHSSEEIAVFIQSIRTILDASDHEPDLSPTDVVRIIETEVENIQQTTSAVAVEIDAPASAPVLAGDLVSRVFRNLMENAIEHNSPPVTITITVEYADPFVEIRLRDDGTGIPVEKRQQLFEAPESGDHGYGMFLTRNLVEVYGGQLRLVETGGEGTEFLVRFEAASTPQRTTEQATVRQPV